MNFIPGHGVKLRICAIFFALTVILLDLCGANSAYAGPFGSPTTGGGPPPPHGKKKDGPAVEAVAPLIDPGIDPTQVTDGIGSITKIEVKGNRKIEADSILARVKSKVGGTYSPTLIRDDVVQIFKTGYFYDVQVDRVLDDAEMPKDPEAAKDPKNQKFKVTYIVSEKPSIVEIEARVTHIHGAAAIAEPVVDIVVNPGRRIG